MKLNFGALLAMTLIAFVVIAVAAAVALHDAADGRSSRTSGIWIVGDGD